jgi:hypothetical protein
MKKTSTLQLSEGIRNAIIVVTIFGIIAAISYYEWSSQL